MNLTASAWKIMRQNEYQKLIQDKQKMWALFSVAMRKAWSNLKKAAATLIIQSAGRALKSIEKAKIQYSFGVPAHGMLVDLEAGYVIFPSIPAAKLLLDEACCIVSNFAKYLCDGLYWFDETEFPGVEEILDELRTLPCNRG